MQGSSQKNGRKLESTKQGVGKVKKDRADQVKARTKTWVDVAKGHKEDESETIDSDKNGNELETTDSVERRDASE